jgi:hypothetical protein
MFALPFDDDRFDVATSFNGIWKGCDDAGCRDAGFIRPHHRWRPGDVKNRQRPLRLHRDLLAH